MGRRRGNTTFPVARIKKIMQSDDDVGKIATTTPVLVAKALECLMEDVLRAAANVAVHRNTKTLSPQHLKHCINEEDQFDFLRTTVEHVPTLDENALEQPAKKKRPRSSAASSGTTSTGRRKRRSPTEKKKAEEEEAVQEDDTALETAPEPSPTPSPPPPPVPRNKEDEENYDDDEDDEGSRTEPVAMEVEEEEVPSAPSTTTPTAERVSVQALLS